MSAEATRKALLVKRFGDLGFTVEDLPMPLGPALAFTLGTADAIVTVLEQNQRDRFASEPKEENLRVTIEVSGRIGDGGIGPLSRVLVAHLERITRS